MGDLLDIGSKRLEKDLVRVVDCILEITGDVLLRDELLVEDETVPLFEILEDAEQVMFTNSADVCKRKARKEKLLMHLWPRIEKFLNAVAVVAGHYDGLHGLEEQQDSFSNYWRVPTLKMFQERRSLDSPVLKLVQLLLT